MAQLKRIQSNFLSGVRTRRNLVNNLLLISLFLFGILAFLTLFRSHTTRKIVRKIIPVQDHHQIIRNEHPTPAHSELEDDYEEEDDEENTKTSQIDHPEPQGSLPTDFNHYDEEVQDGQEIFADYIEGVHGRDPFQLNNTPVNRWEDFQINLDEILEARSNVKGENWDEFIVKVLSEVKFDEVDLISSEAHGRFKEFDQVFQEEFKRIQPGLGEAEDHVQIENFGEELSNKMKEGADVEGYNYHLSQMISPNRSIPDFRHEQCDYIELDQDLPTMSVIIIVHNEPMTTFMRTLHSIVNRTPARLIKEIILVDDVSHYKEFTSGKLERYLMTQFPRGLIRLIKLKARAGIIRARMVGAHLAIGDVLFFTDAHMEYGYKWAEPILHRIKGDRTRVVSPVVDSTSALDLIVDEVDDAYIAGFHWNGWFTWNVVPKYEQERKGVEWAPTRSPVMMGASFGMDRKYFWEMGSYDPEMIVWGGENIELPFRVWMCGGSVEILPCSRVGHLYRAKHTYSWTFGSSESNQTETLVYNGARVAKVWMDEFNVLFFRQYPTWKDKYIGDIEPRKKLRERLGCKSFRWFMDNIFKEKFKAEFADEVLTSGQFQSLFYDEKCLDSNGNYLFYDKSAFNLGIYQCHGANEVFDSQVVYTTKKDTLRMLDQGCLRYGPDNNVTINQCPADLKNVHMDKWEYNDETMQIIHFCSRKCLTLTGDYQIKMEECDNGSIGQKWKYLPINIKG